MASRPRIGAPVRLAATLLLGIALAGAAKGATFTVTDLSDDSVTPAVGSLRWAIEQANASADASDTIVFMLMTPGGTITLEDDLPTLASDVSIDASGAGGLTIDGDTNLILDTDGNDAELVDLNANMGDIALGNADTLTLTANQNFTVGADISDPGAATGVSLVKEGDARVTLAGDNTFTGTIEINAGTLVGDAGSGGSIPDVDIANEGVLIFDQDDDELFGNVISGSGSVEKTGSGNLRLTGPNTYTGGTTISEGTLIVDTDTLPGDVVNDSGLVFLQSGDGTFAGDISGSGPVLVSQDPSYTLELTGTNSYTGGTVLDAGTLTGDTTSLQGDMDLFDASSILRIDEAGSGTFSGDITGMGRVTKAGAGTVSMTGVNDYTGGTDVDAGTLVVDTDSLPSTGTTTLAGGTKLVFDQGSDGTFGGTIAGTGAVTKQGAGTLTIDSAQTYTGSTMVEAGTLNLTGSLASATTIESGATLGGDGMISAPIVLRGTLFPGTGGLETFDAGAGVDFQAGSHFVVRMDDSDASSQLSAGGAVTIDPTATIEVRPEPGDYSLGSTATVVSAASVAGTFLEGEPFAFLTRTVTYPGGNSVAVNLVANGANLATIGQTPNQVAVGTALSTLVGSMDMDVQELFDNMNTLLASEAAPVLDALSGESLTAHTTARVAIGERMQRSIHRRMRAILFASDASWTTPAALRNTRAPVRAARTPDVGAGRFLGERGIGAWIDGYGALGQLDGDGNSADLDYALYGTTVGGDYRLGDHVLAGLAAGYARSDLEVDDRHGDGDADTYQGAAYAAWANRWLFAGVSGRYAFTQSDNQRDIDVGTLMRTARADFDSNDYGLRGELALNAFETGAVSFEPLAGIEWTHLDREGFDESGAGSLGLAVQSETLDAVQAQVGARIHALFEMEEDAVLIPEIRGYYLRELGDDERRLEAQLAGAPIVITGAEAPKDSALVGAGWSIGVGRNLRATAEYDLRIDADRMEHVGTIAIRLRF